MITISIYPPHKTTINKALFGSKKLTKTHYILRSKLIVADEDIDEVVKILTKLSTPFNVK